MVTSIEAIFCMGLEFLLLMNIQSVFAGDVT